MQSQIGIGGWIAIEYGHAPLSLRPHCIRQRASEIALRKLFCVQRSMLVNAARSLAINGKQ